MLVGRKFMELRELTGQTQIEVQQELGINMGLLELGKLDITIVSLRNLCHYFGITEAEFFEGLDLYPTKDNLLPL